MKKKNDFEIHFQIFVIHFSQKLMPNIQMEFIKSLMKANVGNCIYCQGDPVEEIDIPPLRSQSKKYIVLGISGAIFVGSFALTGPFVSPALRKVCLPFVPATNKQVENIVTALKGRHGNVLDIGSGDGRIVLTTAKRGFRSYGVELNYWLVLYSRYQAWRQKQRKTATFFRKDLWKTDLSMYDNIVIFGVGEMMAKLEEKFNKEIPKHCQVISCRSQLSKWDPMFTLGTGLDIVWVYQHPKSDDQWPTTKEELQKLYNFTDEEMRTVELGRTAENSVYEKQSKEDEEDDYDLPSGL